MYEKNQTWVSEIVLLGFQNLKNFKVPLFSLFLLIYIMTVCENVLIIVLVSSSRNLQSPMNSFLQQLALTDLLGSSNIVPTLLQTIIYDGVTVSLHSCIIVFNLFACSESMQCFLLAVMAYDRYAAICNPLRYTSIMNHRVCVRLILMSWALSIVITINTWSMIQTLRFCNETTIDHFFCDLTPLLELSCSNTFFVKLEITLQSVVSLFPPLTLIIGSYICIAREILKIVSNTGRQKAFSTCSSHLAVVSIFYGTLIGVYVVPPIKQSLTTSKVLSLLYTVVIPLVNPIIYSLRNKDMKDALKNELVNGVRTQCRNLPIIRQLFL